MVKKVIICSCEVSAGFSFVSTPAVILFTFLINHITSKTFYFSPPLNFICSEVLHCQITITRIMFLFSCMIYSLPIFIFSFIYHIFCLEGIFSLYSVKSSGMCLSLKYIVGSPISVSIQTIPFSCLKLFKT